MLPNYNFPSFGQYYTTTENEGFLEKIRLKCEGTPHTSLFLPLLCSPFLEGKSQQSCPELALVAFSCPDVALVYF